MVSSALGLSRSPSTILKCQGAYRSTRQSRSCVKLSLAMALLCMSYAIFFVPEKPNQLASICEKHNSVIACQVW